MSAKHAKRVKHLPQRTCVGCRTVLSKRELIRVVRQSEGVQIDLTGKLSGRGAYLHTNRSCWERAMKGGLATALKVTLTEADQQLLLEFMTSLPDEAGNGT